MVTSKLIIPRWSPSRTSLVEPPTRLTRTTHQLKRGKPYHVPATGYMVRVFNQGREPECLRGSLRDVAKGGPNGPPFMDWSGICAFWLTQACACCRESGLGIGVRVQDPFPTPTASRVCWVLTYAGIHLLPRIRLGYWCAASNPVPRSKTMGGKPNAVRFPAYLCVRRALSGMVWRRNSGDARVPA